MASAAGGEHDSTARIRSTQSTPNLEHAAPSEEIGISPVSSSFSLLGDARLNNRGNAPVRIAMMQSVQRSMGNRALRRALQRSPYSTGTNQTPGNTGVIAPTPLFGTVGAMPPLTASEQTSIEISSGKEPVPVQTTPANNATVTVQREPPTTPPTTPPTPAPTPAPAADNRQDLEDREKKAFDAAKGHAGQAAVKVAFSDPLKPPEESEEFKIDKVVEREGYPKRFGFEALGPAIAFASMNAGNAGAVVLKEDTFFFAARLSPGKGSIKFADVWRVNPLHGALAVIGQDSLVYPLNERLDRDYKRAAFSSEGAAAKPGQEGPQRQMATPADAAGMRALAGIKDSGETKPGEDAPRDTTTIPPGQEEAFISRYFRARGLEALQANEIQAHNLAGQFKAQTPGQENNNSTVSTPAQNLIKKAREQGPKYGKILADETNLALQIGEVGRSRLKGGPGEKITVKGETKIAMEWESDLKEKQTKIAEDKNKILSLSPMLAQMVPAQPPPSEVGQLASKAWDFFNPLLPSKVISEFFYGSKSGKEAYDSSLLGKKASDEEIRADYAKKLDDIQKAIRETRVTVLEGDIGDLVSMQGLRSRVESDLKRVPSVNAGLQTALQRMLDEHKVKEMWKTIGETAIQLALLFVPGGQFFSAVFGFALQVADMDKNLKQWDASKAATDPAGALVDQQQAVDQLIDSTAMLAVAAVDLGVSTNAALHGMESGGKKVGGAAEEGTGTKAPAKEGNVQAGEAEGEAKLATEAKVGKPSSPETIKSGEIKMEEHPDFEKTKAEMEQLGFPLSYDKPGAVRVNIVQTVDESGKVLKTEKYIKVDKGMRYLDLEHEIGHVKQVNQMGESALPTERFIQRADGSLKRAKDGTEGILADWQNNVMEYHNRLDEYNRLAQRGVSQELLVEHAGGVRDWRANYVKGLKSSSRKEWAAQHFGDIEAKAKHYESLGGKALEEKAPHRRTMGS